MKSVVANKILLKTKHFNLFTLHFSRTRCRWYAGFSVLHRDAKFLMFYGSCEC